jgi:diacylglycerol kinase (ATP)
MDRKIIYLINPISGVKEKQNSIRIIEEATRSVGIDFEIMYTNPQGNYHFLKNKIEEELFTDVVICGGDGTINKVVKSLIDVDVKVGIIPLGSGNGLANAAKIPKKIEKALSVIFTGNASYIDSFYINDNFSCMLCGLGFDAKVAHDFAQQTTRGLSTYIRQTIKNFFTAQTYSFDITIRGKCFNTEAYFISIANSNQFGNDFTIAPRASLNDGLIDLVVVKKMSKIKMVFCVFKQIFTGKLYEYDEAMFMKKDILYFQSDKFIIKNFSSAPLHIDGEPEQTAPRFSVEVIEDAFKLIQP